MAFRAARTGAAGTPCSSSTRAAGSRAPRAACASTATWNRPRVEAAVAWPLLDARRRFSDKHRQIRRVDYPWKVEILRESWKFLKQEMVHHFRSQPERDSTVHLSATEWPRFVSKEHLLEKGQLPAVITKWGCYRRVVLNRAELERIAFDEKDGHLSHLFKGRLFRIHVGSWIEECVVADCDTHPVEQELKFIKFARHVPGKMTTVPIPVTLSGLWGCPGYRSGGHVDLSMPTIDIECVGERRATLPFHGTLPHSARIPPPFIIDVSGLRLESPYGKITLEDIRSSLPADGTARFSRKYTLEEEVVMCYDPKSIPETPLPLDWKDPNFDHRGGRYHLTYTGFWPRQTTRQ